MIMITSIIVLVNGLSLKQASRKLIYEEKVQELYTSFFLIIFKIGAEKLANVQINELYC